MVKWGWERFGSVEHVFLVDETKLSTHISGMMVGLADEGRCMPRVWRCYVANNKAAYRPEGQVAMMVTLLQQLRTD